MPGGRPAGVAVFDLDGTLTWRDTLLPYLAGYAARHPARLLRVWRLGIALGQFTVSRDRGLLKSRVIAALMGGVARPEIDAWSATFVEGMLGRRMFRSAALEALERHRAAGDHLILLSASPDLYVPRIGALLQFERTLCTELEWRTTPAHGERLGGALLTPNRRGDEKARCIAWLRDQYPGLRLTAYGNSQSDIPHLRIVDQGMLVNGSAAARRQAQRCGIAVGLWT